MKRLLKLTDGHTVFNFDRAINNISKFRITQFTFSNTTATIEPIHVKIDNHSKNYDETNNMTYTLFFLCQGNSSVTYTPSMINEGWFDIGSISSLTMNVSINSSQAGDISARNCYLELEFI